MMKENNNELFGALLIVADVRNKKLRISKQVIRNLNKIGSHEATVYFQFKNLYPDYEEVIVPAIKPLPLMK